MIERILVVNDDGIDSEGVGIAEHIARALAPDVWVVAPDRECSGASASLAHADPVRFEMRAPQRFAIAGRPVDCVLIALHHLMADAPPDLILSGVNRGQNLAEDMTYSGTVGAIKQGLISGIRSIALSQAIKRLDKIFWETAQHYAPDLIRRLIEKGLPKHIALNINFPPVAPSDVAGFAITYQGRREHPLFKMSPPRTDMRGRPYCWLAFEHHLTAPEIGSDLHAVHNGRISVTPIQLDSTDHAAREQLRRDHLGAADFAHQAEA